MGTKLPPAICKLCCIVAAESYVVCFHKKYSLIIDQVLKNSKNLQSFRFYIALYNIFNLCFLQNGFDIAYQTDFMQLAYIMGCPFEKY